MLRVPSTQTKGANLNHEKLPQNKRTENMGSVSTYPWPYSVPHYVCCDTPDIHTNTYTTDSFLPKQTHPKKSQELMSQLSPITLSHPLSPPWVIVSFSMPVGLQTFVTVILFFNLHRPPLTHSPPLWLSNWIHRSEFQRAREEEGGDVRGQRLGYDLCPESRTLLCSVSGCVCMCMHKTETREWVIVVLYLCIYEHSSAVTLVIMFIHEVSHYSMLKV